MSQRNNQKQKVSIREAGRYIIQARDWPKYQTNSFCSPPARVSQQTHSLPFCSTLCTFWALNTEVKNASLFYLKWLATLPSAFQMEWHGHRANILTGMTLWHEELHTPVYPLGWRPPCATYNNLTFFAESLNSLFLASQPYGTQSTTTVPHSSSFSFQ